jgi:ABC-type lipoprotein release transport system permease subunit
MTGARSDWHLVFLSSSLSMRLFSADLLVSQRNSPCRQLGIVELACRPSKLDPVTYAAVSALLMAAAVLSSYLPARRAMAIDPVHALRAE